MSWMLEEIQADRARAEAAIADLRKQVADLECELADLEAAERVIARKLAAHAPAEQPRDAVGKGGTVPVAGQGALPESYAQLWRFAAGAPGAVTCQQVCADLGIELEAKHVEGVRVKLKRLVARGWLREVAPGRFTAASAMAVESGR